MQDLSTGKYGLIALNKSIEDMKKQVSGKLQCSVFVCGCNQAFDIYILVCVCVHANVWWDLKSFTNKIFFHHLQIESLTASNTQLKNQASDHDGLAAESHSIEASGLEKVRFNFGIIIPLAYENLVLELFAYILYVPAPECEHFGQYNNLLDSCSWFVINVLTVKDTASGR